MGHEIVYCFRCQTRLTSAEFDRGAAVRASNKVCCTKCLTPGEKAAYERLKETEKRNKQRTPPGGNRPVANSPSSRRSYREANADGISRRYLRDPSASTTGRGEYRPDLVGRKTSPVGVIIGIVAGTAVLLVIVLAAVFSGGEKTSSRVPGPARPEPSPSPSPGASSTPGPSPKQPSGARAGQANELLVAAQKYAESNPGNVPEIRKRYEDIRWRFDGTPAALEAARELEALKRAATASFEKDLRDLEGEIKVPLSRRNYGVAQSILDRARTRHAHPQWELAVGNLERDLTKTVRDRLKALMEDSDRAAAANEYDRIRKARDEIAGWGPKFARLLDEFTSEYAAMLKADSPSPRTPPETPSPKPPPKAANPYLGPWEKAMFLASRLDFARAGAALLAAADSLTDEKLRNENGADIAEIERLKEIHGELLAAMPKLPPSKKIRIEVSLENGRFVLEAAPTRVGAHRLEFPGNPRFVEYVDISLGSLARLYVGLQREPLPRDKARTLAILCTLDGDADAAAEMLGGDRKGLPQKYWDYASTVRERLPAPDAKRHAAEWSARNLFYDAERDFPLPETRADAMKRYRRLLAEFSETAFVKRIRREITDRIAAGSEVILPAIRMSGHGVFEATNRVVELRRDEIKMLTWASSRDPAVAGLENNVEFRFYASAGVEYRGWALVGGCCRATFGWYLQGTELVHYDRKARKEIACDPSGTAAAPWESGIPAISSHGGRDHSRAEKEISKWDWGTLPIPKYTTDGIKTIRMIGTHKGMGIAAVLITASREKPLNADELRTLADKNVILGPAGTKQPKEWLVLSPFKTGSINTTLPPDTEIKLKYDTSVKEGPTEWKLINPSLKKENGAWKSNVDFNGLGIGGDNRVAYAMIHFRVPVAMKLKLHVYHDDGMKLFLNGQKIREAGDVGSEDTTFEAKPGWNRLLFKIRNGGGGFQVVSHITDLQDQPVKDLRFDPYGLLPH